MESTERPILMSVERAASLLGVSKRWYMQQLRDGKVPGRKVGRNWKLTRADIDGALAVMYRGPGPAGASPTPEPVVKAPPRRRTR